jgi:hypothetical protein
MRILHTSLSLIMSRDYTTTSLNKTLTMAPEALTMAYIYEARKP